MTADMDTVAPAPQEVWVVQVDASLARRQRAIAAALFYPSGGLRRAVAARTEDEISSVAMLDAVRLGVETVANERPGLQGEGRDIRHLRVVGSNGRLLAWLSRRIDPSREGPDRTEGMGRRAADLFAAIHAAILGLNHRGVEVAFQHGDAAEADALCDPSRSRIPSEVGPLPDTARP